MVGSQVCRRVRLYGSVGRSFEFLLGLACLGSFDKAVVFAPVPRFEFIEGMEFALWCFVFGAIFARCVDSIADEASCFVIDLCGRKFLLFHSLIQC